MPHVAVTVYVNIVSEVQAVCGRFGGHTESGLRRNSSRDAAI